MDGPGHDGADGISSAVGAMSLSGSAAGTPDMDDIPDMEEELEEGDDEATAAPTTTDKVIQSRSVSMVYFFILQSSRC